MKTARFERLGRMQRQYHRQHPWRLSPGGLFIPHSYAETKPDSLSWWDDVGFILNGRRVIVWWRHPRQVYATAIEERSWQEAGEDPGDNWLFDGATTNYRTLGRSRKKIVSYTSRSRPMRSSGTTPSSMLYKNGWWPTASNATLRHPGNGSA